jgi:hypothetical protein
MAQYNQDNKEHIAKVSAQWREDNAEYRAKVASQYYRDNSTSRWETPSEYMAQYKPSEADLQKVRLWHECVYVNDY